MPTQASQTELLNLSNQELSDLVEKLGEQRFRARQLADAIFRQRRESLAEVSNLPASLKARLAEAGVAVGFPGVEQRFKSIDGTIRYLMAFADGESVETVWMPEGDFGEAGDGSDAGAEELRSLKAGKSPEDAADGKRESRGAPVLRSAEAASRSRATICVSSQVGCAVNCQFCLTALLGVKRNLSAGEVVGQVIAVLNDRQVDMERQRVNIVFMGMGEPFLNYPQFMKAVGLLVEGVGFPESRMTVSTSGIIPRIHDFGAEPVRPKLAISLNASNDEVRSRIMPINKKWNLEMLMQAARDFPLRNRERITFEYVLLDGVNDSPAHAREVIELVRGIRCKVNLIALNPGPGIQFGTPAEQRVQIFKDLLIKAGLPAFVRRPRGRDIYAACGQLKRTVA